MTVEHFNDITEKVTKQYGAWVSKNTGETWEKQKEFVSTLLIRNKLLKTDQQVEFWQAVGSTCDFIDEPNRKNKDKDWRWEIDVVFCVLYMEHCMKKWSNRKVKTDDEE